MIQFFFFFPSADHQRQAWWTVVESGPVAWKRLVFASRAWVRKRVQHIEQQESKVKCFFLLKIIKPKQRGQQGCNETLLIGAMSQETRKGRTRWSVWATGEDGRWLSTAALKRQNVAHNSDRCSLISAACQHLQHRTVVVFEVDPEPVMFWQSQSFPEQNKSSTSADLTSNHIHRCSNTGLIYVLKSRINERLNRKAAPTPAEVSVLLSGIQEPVDQWCSLSSPPVIFKLLVLRTTLMPEHLKAFTLSGLSGSSSIPSSQIFSAIITHTHQQKILGVRRAAAI